MTQKEYNVKRNMIITKVRNGRLSRDEGATQLKILADEWLYVQKKAGYCAPKYDKDNNEDD